MRAGSLGKAPHHGQEKGAAPNRWRTSANVRCFNGPMEFVWSGSQLACAFSTVQLPKLPGLTTQSASVTAAVKNVLTKCFTKYFVRT